MDNRLCQNANKRKEDRLNNCVFIGNLTADPELRYSTSGVPVATFSIAINEKVKGEEVTEFLDFVCWDKLADTMAEYGRKGRKIGIIAAFHLRRWNADDGSKRSKAEFRARNVEFLDKPPENMQPRQQAATAAPPRQSRPVDDTELDDLPF